MRILPAILLFISIGQFCIAQNFPKSGTITVAIPEEKEEEEEEEADYFIGVDRFISADPFIKVEEMPRYPGGEDAMLRYLGANVNYPDSAKVKGIDGIVYCSFTVDSTGLILNTKVIRGIGGGCDEEALRVINNMPRWNPGKQRGQFVNVRLTMPIKFVLR